MGQINSDVAMRVCILAESLDWRWTVADMLTGMSKNDLLSLKVIGQKLRKALRAHLARKNLSQRKRNPSR